MADETKQFKEFNLRDIKDDEFITGSQARALISNSLTNFAEVSRIIKGLLQSGNFVTGSKGWRLEATGDAEFRNAIIRGNLERNDFYWMTIFESLDGYDIALATIGAVSVTLETAATTSSQAKAIKNPILNFNGLTWDKDRKIRTKVRFFTNTNQSIWLISGDISTARHIGFKVLDGVLYGTVADGTTESTLNCGSVSTSGNGVSLETRFETGVGAEFFVDDISKGTITTNLPSGTAFASRMIEFIVTTDENVAKKITFSFYELWQSV